MKPSRRTIATIAGASLLSLPSCVLLKDTTPLTKDTAVRVMENVNWPLDDNMMRVEKSSSGIRVDYHEYRGPGKVSGGPGASYHYVYLDPEEKTKNIQFKDVTSIRCDFHLGNVVIESPAGSAIFDCSAVGWRHLRTGNVTRPYHTWGMKDVLALLCPKAEITEQDS